MFTRLRSFLSALLRRERFEETMRDELRFHIDAYTEDLVRGGASRAEAARHARLKFGSVEEVRDNCRQARGLRVVDTLARDLRLGIRRLRSTPGFTLMAVLTLAVGIGAGTVAFGLTGAFALRPDGIARPEEVVDVYVNTPSSSFETLSYPEYVDLRDDTRQVFSSIAGSLFVVTQVDRGGGVEPVLAESVTGDYFAMLGVGAAVGRTLNRNDDRTPGAHAVVVLDYRYWRDRFGADDGIVGRDLRVGGRAYTIVGVAAENFGGTMRGIRPAFYAPTTMFDTLMGAELLNVRSNRSMFTKARLRPGATQIQADAQAAAVAARLRDTGVTDWGPRHAFALVPTTEVLYNPSMDGVIWSGMSALMIVVGLLLLLACANLTSFFLARAIDGRKDVALRVALGASRASLVRSLLTETILLGVLGGGVGVALAALGLRLAAGANMPVGFPATLDLGVDWRVLAFGLGISIATGAVLGLLPALHETRADLVSTLKADGPGGGRPRARRWQGALVIAQIAVSLVLLVGAGLFVRSFREVHAIDPGFGRRPAAIMSMMLPTIRVSPDQAQRRVADLLARFREVPGVESVGATDFMYLNLVSTPTMEFLVDGAAPPGGATAFTADRAAVGAGFFDAVGVAIVEGRAFDDTDVREGQRVAIVSEAMARRFWPDGSALGRALRLPGAGNRELAIVGVAADTKVRTLGEARRALIYTPYAQANTPMLTVVARTSGDPELAARLLLSAGREVDPELLVFETTTMARYLDARTLPYRLSAAALSTFALLGLGLAVIGLHGVVRYGVAQRRREVGIRMALGADPRTVVWMLAARGLKLVLIGSLLGLAAAAGLVQPLRSLLFGIQAVDPLTFVVVSAIMAATAILAACLPARRASRMDPLRALRPD